MTRRAYRLLLTLVLLATSAITVHVATADRALETHEMFVAQTSREMLASGDMIVPTFGGRLRLQKPPLMYWAVAGVATISGREDVPPWVARLPSALAAVALAGLAAWLGAVVYNRRAGLLAGAMVGLSEGIFEYGGNARPEMLYAACTALGMLGFVTAWRRRGEPRTLLWSLIGWLGCGLALLAKGPQLPLLLLIGFTGWVLWTAGPRTLLRTLRPLSGLGVLTLLVAPWVAGVILRVDDAVALWTHELIGLRFAGEGGTSLGEWVVEVLTPEYLVYCVKLLAPLGVLTPIAFFVAWDRRRRDLPNGRIVFWMLISALLGLSLATHTRDYYMLPVLPVLAVLLARATIDMFEKAAATTRNTRAVARSLWGLAAAALALPLVIKAVFGLGVLDIVLTLLAFGAAGGGWRVASVRLERGPIPRALAAALAATACCFFLLGNEPELWSSRRERVDDVAVLAAEAAGADLPLLALLYDPDDLVYRLNRPVRGIVPEAAFEEISSAAPAVLVAPPQDIDALAEQGLRVVRGRAITVEGNKAVEVARVVASSERLPQASPDEDGRP